EICPTSNLLTKALADEAAVRDVFRAFVENGVRFTIATDGPQMMHTHLRDEFELLLRIGAVDQDELQEANARGHEASVIDAGARRRLRGGRARAGVARPRVASGGPRGLTGDAPCRRLRRPAGATARPLLVRAAPVHDGRADAPGAAGVLRDVDDPEVGAGGLL